MSEQPAGIAADALPIEDEPLPAAPGPGTLLDNDHYLGATGARRVRVSKVLEVFPDSGLAFMRQHMAERLQAAADLGTELHALAAWYMGGLQAAQRARAERIANGERGGQIMRAERTMLAMVPAERRPWMERFIAWCDKRVRRVVALEQFIEYPGAPGLLGYAGRCDAVAELEDGHLWMVDLKTGSENKKHRIQLAAYCMAWNTQHPEQKVNRRLLLYLPAKGGDADEVALMPATLKRDTENWLAALRVYTWGNT